MLPAVFIPAGSIDRYYIAMTASHPIEQSLTISIVSYWFMDIVRVIQKSINILEF